MNSSFMSQMRAADRSTYERSRGRSPFVIGVAGGSGSGKTTVVSKLRAQLSPESVAVLDQDSYYKDHSHLSARERAALNFDDPSALDHDLLLFHIQQLRMGKSIAKPVYSFATHRRTQEVTIVEPAAFVIVEGIFALYDSRLRSLMDLRLFIDADLDLRFIRRLQRDIVERGRTAESVIAQYLETVRPMYLQHIEPTREFADLQVSCSGSLGPVLQQIDRAIRTASAAGTIPAFETRETIGVR